MNKAVEDATVIREKEQATAKKAIKQYKDPPLPLMLGIPIGAVEKSAASAASPAGFSSRDAVGC